MSLGGSSDLWIVEGILGRGNIFRIMIAIFYGQIDGEKVEAVTDFIFLGFKVTADSNCSHEIKRCLFLGRKVMTSPRQHIKKQRHHFADKSPYSQCYGFSSNYVWIWDWGHKEGWAPKNWCLQIVVLEKTLESPSDCKEIKSVDLNGNQPWIFIRRTDAKAKAPVLWPPNAQSWLTGGDPDAGEDWCWREKWVAEDEMVTVHHQLSGHESD